MVGMKKFIGLTLVLERMGKRTVMNAGKTSTFLSLPQLSRGRNADPWEVHTSSRPHLTRAAHLHISELTLLGWTKSWQLLVLQGEKGAVFSNCLEKSYEMCITI